LLTRLFFGNTLEWEEEALVCQVSEGSWLERHWKYSTTLGHGIIYRPDVRCPETGNKNWWPIQVHEHVHVEQMEAAALSFSIVAAVTAFITWSIWPFVFVWAPFNIYFHVGVWGAALLRGEHPYKGAHTEEAAYSIDGRDKH